MTSASNQDGPWAYTVEAGRELSGEFTVGGSAYDFSVHGPNGLVRQFKGTAAGPEVTVRHDGAGGQVLLVLTNPGATSVRLTVTDAYGNLKHGQTYVLAPGARIADAVPLSRSNNWYDLSVTSDSDATFLRRLAGHVESGRPSTSDPATITR